MGICKLQSTCGYDCCCMECPENEVCKMQCADIDSYEYYGECPEYEREEETMREILFKAKRKDNGEWAEGLPGYDINGNITELEVYKGFANCRIYEIDPETICQYTGLTDKNGKKIWENDICNRNEKYPEIVTHNEGDWQLDYSYALGKRIHTDVCNLGFYVCVRGCVEVIGNIFDNPELLEVE